MSEKKFAMHQNGPTYKIALIGAGNVAWHLGHTFRSRGLIIDRVINHRLGSAKALAAELGCPCSESASDIDPESDYIFIAVDDSHLMEVSAMLKDTSSVVVHTSGSMDLALLAGVGARYGVFYPFQTFTRGIPVDFFEVPVCIEASDQETLKQLHELARVVSRHVVEIDTEQRRWLHLCGVLANNFTNHLTAMAFDLLEKHALDKAILLPLIRETYSKLLKSSAYDTQTGPARRKNHAVIEKQLAMLKDEPGLKKLYSTLTDSIIAYYSE
jgi:predicted short-subunit dehydrogenase-like oxidoreductase (DUF2520 family)